ncbi:MAG: UpxY family transcription antiterminator [Marinifilaceae bacterium]
MQFFKRTYNWHAVYTKSRAEKMLFASLQEKSIECYLPLKKELRQWSDRKKWVEEPLIRSYLFVRVSEKEYYDVLNTKGAVRYITFGGKAAPIPLNQIEALRIFLEDERRRVELSSSDLKRGDWVEVVGGPLKGVQGEVLQFRGRHRIVLRFRSLGYCVHTDISLNEVKRMQRQVS